MEQKYYDHLKPKLPKQSFSDVVNQQMEIVQKQQQLRAAQDMQIMKARQKQMEAQQKQLLGYDVADMSEVDKQTFGAKRDWLKGRIDNYYYGPQNYGQFVEDVNALKTLHAELKNHSDNVSTSMKNLEGWVTGTKDWTNKDLELKDDMNTLNAKRQMWEMSGIDPESLTVDENGDTYAYYTDINGQRLKDANGQDMYGLASQAPSRGSQEYFSPTTSPYANLLPGEFSKKFASSLVKLRQNPDQTVAEKEAIMRQWVTASVMKNQSAMATARSTFQNSYGEEFESVLAQDQQANQGEGYVPMDIRDYINETMRFLPVEVQSDSEGSGVNPQDEVFPTSARFNVAEFPTVPAFFPDPDQPELQAPGTGVSAMFVPRTTQGRSTMVVQLGVDKNDLPDSDPRKAMAGDSYKVSTVALDVNKNMFIKANVRVKVPKNEMTQAERERLESLPGYDPNSEEMVEVYRDVPIFIKAPEPGSQDTIEYLSISKNIAISSGYSGSDEDLMEKGMEIIKANNDRVQQELDSI